MEYRRVRLNQGQTADNNLNFATETDMINANLAKISFIAPWCCHGLRRNFFMPYFQDEWRGDTYVDCDGWRSLGLLRRRPRSHEPDHRIRLVINSTGSAWVRARSTLCQSRPRPVQSILQRARKIQACITPATGILTPESPWLGHRASFEERPSFGLDSASITVRLKMTI